MVKRVEHKIINNEEHKRCPKCSEWKPLDCFNRSSSAWDKLQVHCTLCKRKIYEKWYIKKEGFDPRVILHKVVDKEELKWCYDCRSWKSVKLFSKNRRRWDNLDDRCKQCCREYRDKTINKRKEYDRGYYKNNSEGILKRSKKHYRDNTKTYKERAYKWMQDNIDQKKRLDAKYYENNLEILREQSRVWRKSNKDKIKKYYRENPERFARYNKDNRRKRRALRLQVEENYRVEDEQYTRSLFNNMCINCGSGEKLTIDHFYPLSKGNALTRQNAIVLCKSCNSSKGVKDPREFFGEDKFNEIIQIIKVEVN